METEEEKAPTNEGKEKKRKGMPHAYDLMPSKAPLRLHCEWGDCEAMYTNMIDFRKHVQAHLWDLFNTVKGSDNECESFANIACDWRQCDSACGRGFPELVRHVYFHAFHARLKSVGSYIVQVRNAPSCKLEDTSRNVIPELPEQLICHWKNCKEQFDDPTVFYDHCNSHIEEFPATKHPPGGVTCKWDVCEQKVQNKHRMREHLRSHTQERIVACANCGTLFANNTKLLDHLLRQKDISDGFQCSHCNKAFSTERLLRDHMRNHVNHYKCPLCEMTCPSPANLRTHLNTRHSEERPHACSMCEKRFKLPTDLRRHQETHSDTTFACNIGECKFVCVSYKQLLAHFKKEHEGEAAKRVYRCHICYSEYTRGGLLTNHLRKIHNFQWPPGHQRFRYRQNEEGVYLLQTLRYESLELSEQIYTEDGENKGTLKTPGKDNKRSRFRPIIAAELKVAPECDDQEEDRMGVEFSNLEMLGDIATLQGSKRKKYPNDKIGTSSYGIMQSRGKQPPNKGVKQNANAKTSPQSVAPSGLQGVSPLQLALKKSGVILSVPSAPIAGTSPATSVEANPTITGLLNARRKLCMDFDGGDATAITPTPSKGGKRAVAKKSTAKASRGRKSAANTSNTSINSTSSESNEHESHFSNPNIYIDNAEDSYESDSHNQSDPTDEPPYKRPRRPKKNLTSIIENLSGDRRHPRDDSSNSCTISGNSNSRSQFDGYADSVLCTDSDSTIKATSTDSGGMEVTWSSDCGSSNLEIDLPPAFSDCDSVSLSVNGQEKTVPIMNMPVVIFGDEVHTRKQKTPVKVISHDNM